MPRYTGDYSKTELEKTVLAALHKLSQKDVQALPDTSDAYARLTTTVAKDISKIRADFSIVSANNTEMCDIVGLHDIDIPHFLSRAADPKHFERMRLDVQEKYENATGKMSFLGCLSASNNNETPVFFLLYICGGGLRAYVPQQGNSFDKKTKTARPKEQGQSLRDCFDIDAIKKDIQSRIHCVDNTGLSDIPDAKF